MQPGFGPIYAAFGGSGEEYIELRRCLRRWLSVTFLPILMGVSKFALGGNEVALGRIIIPIPCI